MSLLDVTQLSHSFGDKILYQNAAFSLYKGERMGVVGLNGAGKSTLVSILTGALLPDSGSIVWSPRIRIGYLDQHALLKQSVSIRAYLKTAFSALYELEKEAEAAYARYAQTGEEKELFTASAAQTALEAGDFYTVDTRIEKVAAGLGLTALGMERPLAELSGGQRAKVILARLLLESPDVLLLDEPTNFLDEAHVDWLAGYLGGFSGAAIVVSHDDQFLARISTCILDIEAYTLRKYHGAYADYLRQKKSLREDHIRRYHSQQQMIARTEAFIRKNIAGVNSKNAKGRRKQLEHIERIAPPTFTSKPSFRFGELPCPVQNALMAEELEVGYHSPLLPKLNFAVKGGEKLVITGFNGIGKSTLLKTLLGMLPPIHGSFSYSPIIKTGYYEQDLRWEDDSITPIEIIHNAYPSMAEKEIRKRLAGCGVKADCVREKIASLSGGEQSKVKLCRLLLSPCNFLILDEPTNHLDADTKAELQAALKEFRGSVLFVTHEAPFYRGWADRVWKIEETWEAKK